MEFNFFLCAFVENSQYLLYCKYEGDTEKEVGKKGLRGIYVWKRNKASLRNKDSFTFELHMFVLHKEMPQDLKLHG